ncbi:STY4528 family pathogenicity island replication protein [Exercitatus varius]|uniref:STY4528 family pathogenicity island replication protein n=1 Tax=Exercitatus varius TaxID=67857 RepID=UPI00294AD2EF|nr:STY4528 family pathogenicity island replication protein [Exercitatus varius]MDG2961744.1 STY4528 family pathogenicity island replication protein [Exercitatus varius]
MEQFKQTKHRAENGLLFFGNQHETVPTRLLQDVYLTPRAKFAWQLIKSKAREFQGGLFPSYEVLGKLLSDKPYLDISLSRKVVTQTLLLLRLTRWLTLCETVRSHQGYVLGNIYLLHDEPMPVLETIQLNEDYLNLLEKSSQHKDPVVRGVATHIIDNLLSDKTQWHYVSHIDWLKVRYQSYQQRLDKQPTAISEASAYLENFQEKLLSSDMELGQNIDKTLSSKLELSQKTENSLSSNLELSERMKNSLSSKMELREKTINNSLISQAVPNWNSGVQYSTSNIYTNTYCTGQIHEMQWPAEIVMTEFEKISAIKAMRGLDLGICRAILLEAQQRILKGEVKKPKGYLYRLIQLAHSGQFKPYHFEQQENSQAHQESSLNPKPVKPANAVIQAQKLVLSDEETKNRVEQMRLFRQQLLSV